MTEINKQFTLTASHYTEPSISEVLDGDELSDEIDLSKWARLNSLMGNETMADSVVGRVAAFKALRSKNPGVFLRAELPTETNSLNDLVSISDEGLKHYREINTDLVDTIRSKYGIKQPGITDLYKTDGSVQERTIHTTDQNFAFVEFAGYNGAASEEDIEHKNPNEYRLFIYSLDNGTPRGDIDADELLAATEK